MSDVLIKVENVSKKFCRSLKRSLWYGVQDIFRDLNPSGHSDTGGVPPKVPSVDEGKPSGARPGEFWAVNGVSFELRRGECLGLIGHNGAGKTTLLKMLNGLIKPDHGRIQMRGRIGALIALGAGFNPILTGRENVYVNGSVLGLKKKEIAEKLDEIIDFADIRDFIDAPVQSYSSGMQVRLGFAVATALEPDVLILDEVLAVGDVSFRTKCFVRISTLLSNAAVVFVSHSEEQLSRICTKGMLLDHGKVLASGELKTCLEVYRKKQNQRGSSVAPYHDALVRLADVKPRSLEHVSGEDFVMEITYDVLESISLSLHVLSLVDESGLAIAVCDLLPVCSTIRQGTSFRTIAIKALSLRPGVYTLGLEALATNHGAIMVRKRLPYQIHIKDAISYWCSYTPKVSLIEPVVP